MRRVVVTGVGVISAIGNNAIDFFKSLIACKSGSELIHGLPRGEIDAQVAAQVRNFDPSKYFEVQQIGMHDRFSQFALAAAGDAMRESGYLPKGEELERFAVSIGTGLGGME